MQWRLGVASKQNSAILNGCLDGLPPRIALWRLLTHLGVKTSLQFLDEDGDGDFSLAGIFQKLKNHGFEARCVQAQLNDLPNLRLPTLILTKEEEWILLKKLTSKGWLVEHGGGSGIAVETDLASAFAGTALEINTVFPETGNVWIRLIKLLPEHRKFILLALITTMLVQLFALMGPWLTATMMETLKKGSSSVITILCAGLILSAFFKAWVGFFRDITLSSFSSRVDAALEKGLFDHLLHLPFKYLQGKTLGELLQAFAGIYRARSLVLDQGLGTLFDATTAITYLIYMLFLMPGATGFVVAGALLLSGVSVVIGYFQMQLSRKAIKARQAQRSALAELLKGAPTLKATGSQSWAMERWKERQEEELDLLLKQERLDLWEGGISDLVLVGSSSTILIWGGYAYLNNDLSLGNLLAFSMLSSSFITAVTSVSQSFLNLALAKPQLAEVKEAFATARQPRDPLTGSDKLESPILAEDVWFRYKEKGPWVLQGIQLKVKPGTFHHVKGASGSGKSTLLKLLAGLYSPDNGRISISGMDPSSATRLMVFLPQFPQLSSGSILENLRVFSGDAPKTHLMTVAKETGLYDWVKTLPMGYQTMVSSGGTNLSGGQRQLIAMTAILASDKQLLLLDEALSNIDWVSRQKIIRSHRLHGRTIIYASHEEVFMGTEDPEKSEADAWNIA